MSAISMLSSSPVYDNEFLNNIKNIKYFIKKTKIILRPPWLKYFKNSWISYVSCLKKRLIYLMSIWQKSDFFGIIFNKFFLEVMSISLRNCEHLTDIFYSILRDYYFNQYLKNIDLKLSAFSFVKQYVPDGISL